MVPGQREKAGELFRSSIHDGMLSVIIRIALMRRF